MLFWNLLPWKLVWYGLKDKNVKPRPSVRTLNQILNVSAKWILDAEKDVADLCIIKNNVGISRPLSVFCFSHQDLIPESSFSLYARNCWVISAYFLIPSSINFIIIIFLVGKRKLKVKIQAIFFSVEKGIRQSEWKSIEDQLF